MALLKMEPRHPERPDLGCCLGLLALPPCALASASWALLLAPSTRGTLDRSHPKLPSRASLLLVPLGSSFSILCLWLARSSLQLSELPHRPCLCVWSLRVCVWARRGVLVQAQAARGRGGESVTAEATGLLPWVERSPAAEGTSWGAGVSCRDEEALGSLPSFSLLALSVPGSVSDSVSLCVSVSRPLSLSLPPSLPSSLARLFSVSG